MRRAREVRAGERLRVGTGAIVKVLCSVPEAQSAPSGSTTAWHIEGYAPGLPTWRTICDPEMAVEVVG
jgi:hypothetical protein